MSVQRNELCPCGSQKKFKKCCWLNNSGPSMELVWRRLNGLRMDLPIEITKFIRKVYGDECIGEAWEEFCLWVDSGEIDEHPMLYPLFWPWFFYHWSPVADDTSVEDENLFEVVPGRAFLKAKKNYLDPLIIAHIESCLAAQLSFFEILSVRSGESALVEDLLMGTQHQIIEKAGSTQWKIGDLVFGTVVESNGVCTFGSSAEILISPIYKTLVIDFRINLINKKRHLTKEELEDSDFEVLELFWDIYENLIDPPIPVFSNTDGDEWVQQTLSYVIVEDSMKIFEALCDLCFEHTREEILKQATLDKKGKLIKTEFPWLRPGHPKSNTVLANIVIQNDRLEVSLNSNQRATKFKSLIKKRLPTGLVFLKKHVDEDFDPRQVMESSRNQKHMGLPTPMIETEEMKEFKRSFLREHWKNWVDTKLPILDNKTPKQCLRSKLGRQKLMALLNDFDRKIHLGPDPETQKECLLLVRQQLGLLKDE